MSKDDFELPWDDDFKAELKAIENAPLAELNKEGQSLRKTNRPLSNAYKRNLKGMASRISEDDANVGAVNSIGLSELEECDKPIPDM